MNALRSSNASIITMTLLLSGAAFAQRCDAHREAWMDSLKAHGIKAVDVAVDFDFFRDSHIALHVKSVHYFNDYVMNGFSELKPDLLRSLPSDLKSQLISAAEKEMEKPLRDGLAEQHVTQGRGTFAYPITDDPCRQGEYFAPLVLGPTPLEIRPEGKRLAVVSDIGEIQTINGRKQIQVKVMSDDRWLYTYNDARRLFRKGENVTIEESKGYLVLKSLDGNTRTARVKIVEKTRFGYL